MLLGLDLGTTNVKAAVAGLDGAVLGQGAVAVKLFHLEGGGVEQDLEEIWAAALEAIAQAVRGIDPKAIEAVGISSQGGAMQLLTGEHQPAGRVISWLDSRGQGYDAALTAELGRDWFRKRLYHGGSGLAIGQLLRLRRETPALLAGPSRVGFVGDIVTGRLCGRAAHDGTSCTLTLLYDPARRDYAAEVLGRLGLERSQLPDLAPAGTAAGGLAPAVARRLGLRPGIPVSPAIHDQYASALGSGVVRAGDILFGAGTAWVLLAVQDRLAEPVTDEAFVCHHVVEGRFGQIVSLRNGGSAFQWGVRLLGWEQLSGAEVDLRLQSVPAGCGGLVCRPLLGAFDVTGLPVGMRGGFEGLQLGHTPAHVLRAILEGLAFELQRHLGFLGQAGLPARRLVMAGGAAKSAVTPQLIADVTGLPLTCLAEGEGSLRGALVLARSLLPGQGSLGALAEEMAPGGRVVNPGTDHGSYQEQFKKYLQCVNQTFLGVSDATPLGLGSCLSIHPG